MAVNTQRAASVLYGGGNTSISDDDIRNFIGSAKSNDDILKAAVKNNVSVDQISSAMGGQGGFNKSGISSYLKNQGIQNPVNTQKPINTQKASSTVYGSGNPNISSSQIRDYVSNAGSADDVLRGALKHGVSASQISDAFNDQGDFSSQNVTDYLSSKGILDNSAPPPPTTGRPAPTYRPAPVPRPAPVNVPQIDFSGLIKELQNQRQERAQVPTPIQAPPAEVFTPSVNHSTGTVQGQLAQITQDPNNPLMVSARARGLQQANKRGLLNSSLGTSAAEQAMLDQATGIATSDAGIYNERALQNAAAQNQNAMFNAQNQLQAQQFNAGQQADIGMFNAGNSLQRQLSNTQYGLQAAQANAANALQAGIFNADTASRLGMFDTEQSVKTRMFDAGLEADLGKFNAGLAADILNNRESLANTLAINELDADIRYRIAGIQARAEESRLGAGIIDSLVQKHASILQDPKMPADAKADAFNQVLDTSMMAFDILDSIDSTGLQDKLSNLSTANTTDDSKVEEDAPPLPDDDKPAKPIININNQPVSAKNVRLLQGINEKNGTRIDPKRLVSDAELSAVDFPTKYYEPVNLYTSDQVVQSGLYVHPA